MTTGQVWAGVDVGKEQHWVGIVKLFENARGSVDVSGFGGGM
jgi:hypothetical protein